MKVFKLHIFEIIKYVRKAFDTLDWRFFIPAFGFDEIVCLWILAILKFAKLFILVNGKIVGYFPCMRVACLSSLPDKWSNNSSSLLEVI